jgi:energy-coupling factor transporter ATP-binding protein EcfA2
MNEWKWNGARWWKFDFHTHTPKSDDYGKRSPQQAELKARTPREWLLYYMRAGLDCVAVTDHNSGAWIDDLNAALIELGREKPDGYRQLHLFPGVELSVHGGIHVLAIFGPGTTTSNIDSLLGSVGFAGTTGKPDAVTTKTLTEVAAEISKANGIAIPAHVDEDNGIFKELQGLTLQQVLDCKRIFAMEIVNANYLKPQAYASTGLNWTEVIGSDAHHPSGRPDENYPGSRFTWIKMGAPSIEGLRLAMLDGALSVIRSDGTQTDPNAHAEMVIESVEIEKAKFMGRPSAFNLLLNPWMNALIGGRGTGKSTLVEFIRIAMRREEELPNDLKRDFEKYRQTYANRDESGLLTDEALIRVVYRKNGIRYRIQWSPDGKLEPIEEQQPEGEWQKSEGDIPQRFPVRMYSQKQVFQLAKEPLALMRIVNDAPEVGYREWHREVETEENKFLAFRTKVREIEAGLSDEPRLKGELEDITRKLAVFEKGRHAELYKALQDRKRQESALESWETGISEVGATLRNVADRIEPENIDDSAFDTSRSEDRAILDQAHKVSASISGFSSDVKRMADEADKVIALWRETRNASEWRKAVAQAVEAYGALEKRMAGEGISNSAEYGLLVQRRQSIERHLKEFAGRREHITKINDQANECLVRIKAARRMITRKRESLFTEVLRDNRLVRISVVPYGAKENIVEEFRNLIQRPDSGFDKDIGEPGQGGLLGNLYDGEPTSDVLEERVESLKNTVRIIAGNPQQADVADRRFATHLAKLPPEALDRLDLWFPEDSLAVEYCSPSDRQSFRPIHEGSPVQQPAALLAFLLTYGHEPLILDQPEDDLDNHHIYGLIVGQLREIKRKRQIIVVTHNANIVVNGDAELVVALAARGGQTQQEASGSLQDKAVRQTICEVMEGGEKAFEQRYRRIALEVHHV